MEITYEGCDISGYIFVRKCVSSDTAINRCDSLDIEFENAAGWYGWAPQEDDKIIVSHNGYDTGIMYVNSILPENGKYRIFATSIPSAARVKGYQSFTQKSIEEIMRICAISSGLEYRIYGIDPGIVIPYTERNYEGYASFLYRLLKMEGAVLKCVNGRFVAIGIEYAQNLDPHQTLSITSDMGALDYKRCGKRYRSLTVQTPYATASAMDTAVTGNHAMILNDIPARDAIQAGRWARGLLLYENRQYESLAIATEFNAGFTAMTRIDIKDEVDKSDAVGEWLIEEAKHDFVNKKSSAVMRRCVTTIK